jgi:hypothetical protein
VTVVELLHIRDAAATFTLLDTFDEVVVAFAI